MCLSEEVTTLPSMIISPLSGFSRPAMHLSVVVFPHPDGPSNVRTSRPTVNETLLTAADLDPLTNRLVRFLTSMTDDELSFLCSKLTEDKVAMLCRLFAGVSHIITVSAGSVIYSNRLVSRSD